MILGYFSSRYTEEHSEMLNRVAMISSFGRNAFKKVILKGFEGGYFHCPNLLYREADYTFRNENKDIMVLMSGSVYNRTELCQKVNVYSEIPDPELVSILFLKNGPGFIEDLNGDFVICIHRPESNCSFIYRDHVGVRPLAVASVGKSVFFSSDILGLSRIISGGKSIDPEYLLTKFKYIDLRKGPCQEVTKLPPGHYLSYSATETKVIPYWKPEEIKVNREADYTIMLSELKEILSDAVKIRCDARFTAGVHVTGGLDSGIVSMLAHKEYHDQGRFYGFSWTPEDFMPEKIKYDERKVIDKSYQDTGISVVYASVERDEFPGLVNNYYYNQGYFSEDKAGDAALQNGTNLIFSGWGGDEFVSTADRGIDIDLLFGFRLRTFFRRNQVATPRRFIKYLLIYVINPLLGILDRDTARSFREESKYLKRRYRRSDARAVRTFYFHSSRRQMHLRLLRHYHLQHRCENWYVNGYRKGLEYRYPLLDKRIIEFMLAFPSELLCRTDAFRPLLREVGEDILPREILAHLDKTDPVYWSYINNLFEKSAVSYMNEIEEWETNHDLSFVDFKLLAADVRRSMQTHGVAGNDSLSRALVYLKALHEFTLEYRKTGEPE